MVSLNFDFIFQITLILGAIGAGLSALNLNPLSFCQCPPLHLAVKILCGVAGGYGAYMLINTYHVLPVDTFLLLVNIILVTTNIIIGLSGLGITIYLGILQKPMQLLAGAAGVYSLIPFFTRG